MGKFPHRYLPPAYYADAYPLYRATSWEFTRALFIESLITRQRKPQKDAAVGVAVD